MSHDDQTIRVYGSEAARYAEVTKDAGSDPVLRLFLDHLSPASTILDLGCGPGIASGIMASEGHTVTATDAGGLSDVDEFEFAVTGSNDAPDLADYDPATVDATEDVAISILAPEVIDDDDDSGFTYTAQLDDGSPLPADSASNVRAAAALKYASCCAGSSKRR